MKRFYLRICLTGALGIVGCPAYTQQILNSSALPANYSDNMVPSPQLGTEIINTPTGQSVHFGVNPALGFYGGSFEHVGQFYVAASGVYDGSNNSSSDHRTGIDYFGYAPAGAGTYNGPYLGTGIMGASPANGGTGAGRPTFGALILTSTGDFPVAGGMKINYSLRFLTAPGSGGNIVKVPDGQEVIFVYSEAIGTNDANYIDGKVICNMNLLVSQVFPVGDSQNTEHPYHPLTTTGISSTGVRYLNANPQPVEPAYLDASLQAVSAVGYWTIDALGLHSLISVSIPQPSRLGTNPNPADLRLVGWTGSTWVVLGAGGALAPATGSGSDLNGYSLSAGITSYIASLGIKAIGIGLLKNAALPVNLVSFTGYFVEGLGTTLSWQTSLETNNDHFEIQRSGDAKSFEPIGRIQGRSNTEALSNYAFVDSTILTDIAYYRLRQVDIDGSQHFSSIIAVRYGNKAPVGLTISPNPVEHSLNLGLTNGEKIEEAKIFDLKGRQLRQAIASEPEVLSLPSGIYVLDVRTKTGQSIRRRFVKR